jgi:hypothetical protein
MTVHSKINLRAHLQQQMKPLYDIEKVPNAMKANYLAAGKDPYASKKAQTIKIHFCQVGGMSPVPIKGFEEALKFCHMWNAVLLTEIRNP